MVVTVDLEQTLYHRHLQDRESYRLNEELFRRNLDIVVIARPAAKGRSYQEIESAFMHLAGKHQIIEEVHTDEETSY